MQSSEVQGGMRSSSTTLTFGAMKGEKMTKSTKAQIQNFVIRDMFLTPNVNAYERNILSTPNGNVHKRRVFRRATQYVKVCGYDKEQWASQATTQR